MMRLAPRDRAPTTAAMPDGGGARWDDLARGFAAIGAPARLRVLRLLVRAGGGGLAVGEIGARLGIAPSTLAHHLRALADGGLIEQRRAGRQTLCSARFDRLEALSGFILDECCAEAPEGMQDGAKQASERGERHD